MENSNKMFLRSMEKDINDIQEIIKSQINILKIIAKEEKDFFEKLSYAEMDLANASIKYDKALRVIQYILREVK